MASAVDCTSPVQQKTKVRRRAQYILPDSRLTSVDDQTSVQTLGGTGKLGQDHDSVLLDLTRDVLVGDQVHPISSRGDETSIRQCVHGRELIHGYTGVHEMNGHEFDRSELTVDTSDELFRHASQVLVLFDVLSRRNGELDEDDLADPFRVLVQESLERVKLLRYTLDVIQSVDTDNDLDALESLFQLSQTFLNGRLLETVDELHGFDTDREGTDVSVSSLEPKTVGHGGKTEDTGARRQEVSSVVVGVETDHNVGKGISVPPLTSYHTRMPATHPIKSHCNTPNKISLLTGKIL